MCSDWIARDLMIALRYKLIMFGVPLDGPSDVSCDNKGVVNKMSLYWYNLGKKNNAVYYHVVREAVAAEILWVRKEDT